MADSTLYDVLGVAADVDDDGLRHAYRLMVGLSHPDKDTGNAAWFRSVQAAYDVLSDPARRAAYDASLRHPDGAAHAGTGGPRVRSRWESVPHNAPPPPGGFGDPRSDAGWSRVPPSPAPPPAGWLRAPRPLGASDQTFIVLFALLLAARVALHAAGSSWGRDVGGWQTTVMLAAALLAGRGWIQRSGLRLATAAAVVLFVPYALGTVMWATILFVVFVVPPRALWRAIRR
ncbi:MAG TPA: J domain-containing protein [Acidimicrobiales bacterium]|nr:J domain-containing protein [Acidimicrobiales bacterium]